MEHSIRSCLLCATFVLACVLAACSGSSGDAGGPGVSADLASTGWVLTSLHGSSPIEDTEITLYSEPEYFGGTAGCNGYGGGPDSGRYAATEDGTLTIIQPLAVTVQLCSEPEGIMEQEAVYLRALVSAATYRMIDGRLEIVDVDGETTLVYARRVGYDG